MKNFKTLDKREGLELNHKIALNKKDGEIFFSAISTFKNEEFPRWKHDLLCAEIIQKRTLNPASCSLTEFDKIYNEVEEVLRVWIDITFIDSMEFIHYISEDFLMLYDIWNEYETILNKDNLAVINILTEKIFRGWEASKFNIVVFETTDVNELPEFILETVKKDPELIFQYAIKNHKNEFIVDSKGNLIFRFNYISFAEEPLDFLITGKKIKKTKPPIEPFPYKIENTPGISQLNKLKEIEKRYTNKKSGLEYVRITFDNPYEMEETSYIRELPFSVMYDNFLPQFNFLHSEKYNYEKDNKVTTNGIFMHKPRTYRGERNIYNVGIGILFNKLGLVYRLEGDYDLLKKHRSEVAREFRYFNNEDPSDSTALYTIEGKKISWKFYDPNSPMNKLHGEPKEYVQYEGEFHDYALLLSSYVTYYDQTYRKFKKMNAFENCIFDLYEV